VIYLNGVKKTFVGKEGTVEAVKGVDVHIAPGDIYGIIGYSGAGKSTLVRCINLLEVPTEGQVIVDNKDLTAMDEKSLRNVRKKIGMIFQHFNLFRSRTVFDNIAYPLKGSGLSKEETKQKVRSLLQLVDMADKENAYPSQLSGGQKQRVAIARALANDPKVLLCDEATSALDPQTTGSILKLLKKLNETLGLTIVIITHEMAVVKEICTRVAVMEEGRVAEEGSVLDIFSDPKAPITREFIRTTTNMQKIYELVEEDDPVTRVGNNEVLLQLTYNGDNVGEAVISNVTRKYDVDVNIVFGNIEFIGNHQIGRIVAILSGEVNKVGEAIQYIADQHVGIEVIKDGRILN